MNEKRCWIHHDVLGYDIDFHVLLCCTRCGAVRELSPIARLRHWLYLRQLKQHFKNGGVLFQTVSHMLAWENR